MDVPFKSILGFAQGAGPKTETSERLLQRQTLRRIWTTVSLANLSLGFSVFGILIVLNRHRADLNGPSGDSFVAAIGGIGGLVIGIVFLVAACLHLRTMFGSGAHCTRLDPWQQREEKQQRMVFVTEGQAIVARHEVPG
jgi:hypothetical protein